MSFFHLDESNPTIVQIDSSLKDIFTWKIRKKEEMNLSAINTTSKEEL